MSALLVVRNRGAAALLAAALATIPLAGTAADPYEINAILSLTGSAAFVGKEEAAALTVVESDVNKSGGIAGRPIKFVVADDQSSPQVAVQLANDLIAKKVPVAIGPTLTATCGAITALVKDGPVVYCLSAGVHPPAGSYMFSAGVSSTASLSATAHYIRLRGWKKVAIITSTDATGQDAEQGIDAAFGTPDNSSVTLVLHEHFNPTDISVAAQMSEIRASGAQAMIAWTTGTPLGTLLRGAFESGLDIPIVTSPANLTYEQMKAYTSFMPKQLLFPGSPGFGSGQLPAGPLKQSIARTIAALNAAGQKPAEGQFLAWDPAVIVVEALKKNGLGAGAGQIRDYIANLRGFLGVFGEHDFQAIPQRGVGVNSVTMLRWDTVKGTWVGMSRPGGTPL